MPNIPKLETIWYNSSRLYVIPQKDTKGGQDSVDSHRRSRHRFDGGVVRTHTVVQRLLAFHHLQKDVVGDVHFRMCEHFLFSALLLFKQLHFARNIASVQIPRHVFAKR